MVCPLLLGFVTDQNGELYEHIEYFPFGETWVQEKSNTQRMPYLYTGKELDEETGLYYYGARYYDPRTGVWASADPILGEYLPRAGQRALPGMGGISNPFNLGLYSYAHQNPIKLIDPDGKQAGRPDWTAAGATVGATGGAVIGGVAGAVGGLACGPGAPACSTAGAGAGAAAGGALGLKVGTIVGAAIDLVEEVTHAINVWNESSEGENAEAPPLPKGLVGSQDDPRAGPSRGKRHNSGPLLPENGGSGGNAEEDFKTLGGPTSRPEPRRGEGARIAPNGISIRPGKEGEGPRIDIPANGSKPHETLHYEE